MSLLLIARVVAWKDVLSIQLVCENDTYRCPHGGLALRDQRLDCRFTPCESVPAPAASDTQDSDQKRWASLSVQALKQQTASFWFRNSEFFIPSICMECVQRGRLLEQQLHAVLDSKRTWLRRSGFGAALDLYVVQKEVNDESYEQPNHFGLLQTAVDPTHAEALVVNHPFSRFQFLSKAHESPTAATCQTVLRLLQEKLANLTAGYVLGHTPREVKGRAFLQTANAGITVPWHDIIEHAELNFPGKEKTSESYHGSFAVLLTSFEHFLSLPTENSRPSTERDPFPGYLGLWTVSRTSCGSEPPNTTTRGWNARIETHRNDSRNGATGSCTCWMTLRHNGVPAQQMEHVVLC